MLVNLLQCYVIFGVVIPISGSLNCPNIDPCKCSTTRNIDNIKKTPTILLDCSNKQLLRHPDFEQLKGNQSLQSIERLDLGNISVERLPIKQYDGLNIEILDLSDSKIGNVAEVLNAIDPDTENMILDNSNVNSVVLSSLIRFHNLTWLSLSRNNLDVRILPNGFLTNFIQLMHLDLSGNDLRFAQSFLQLQELSNLKHINLRNTNLELEKPTCLDFLKNMHSLEELILDNNCQQALNLGQIFQNLNLFSLTFLSLQTNNILKMDDNAFNGIKNLEILDLSNNMLPGFPFAVTATLRNLTHLNMSSNDVQFILDDTFKNMTQLEYLNLRNNKLESFPRFSFRGFGNTLKILDLSCNRLRGGYYWVPGLRPLWSLQRLNISYNKLQHIQNDSFDSTAYLQELDISGNPLLFTDTMFSGIEFSLKRLYMKNLKMEHAPLRSLQTIAELEVLDLSGNKIGNPTNMFLKEVNTRNLYLRNMNISELFEKAFTGMTGSVSVFLDNNNIISLDFVNNYKSCFFKTISLRSNPVTCDCSSLYLYLSGRIEHIIGHCVNKDFRNIVLENQTLVEETFGRLCGKMNIISGQCTSTGKFIANCANIVCSHIFAFLFSLLFCCLFN